MALIGFTTESLGWAQTELRGEEEKEHARKIGQRREIEVLEAAVRAILRQIRALDARADAVDQTLADINEQANGLAARVSAVEAALKPAAVSVDCNAGRTIAAALATPGRPLTITVVGTCNENLTIRREDVTLLAGAGGATINGPDVAANTVRVLADRVTIDGLTITGGRSGVVAEGAGQFFIQNASVGPSGVNGIVIFHGAEGFVTNCTVHDSGAIGIEVQAGAAVITTSTVTGNGTAGILLSNGGHARIGTTTTAAPAGNTISSNGSSGVYVALGSNAFIAANVISGNGTNPASPLGRAGITVFHATADLGSGNTISGNAGNGVALTAAQVLFGDAVFGTAPNTISGNGTLVSGTGGLSLTLGAQAEIINTVIESNTGFGLSIALRSSVLAFGAIRNNTGNGILLQTGGAALGTPSLSGNGAIAVKCVGDEASIALTGVAATDIDPACTGF